MERALRDSPVGSFCGNVPDLSVLGEALCQRPHNAVVSLSSTDFHSFGLRCASGTCCLCRASLACSYTKYTEQSYMAFGIGLWYSTSWQYLLRGLSVTQIGINWVPFGLSSVLAVFFAAWLIPRVAAQWIMAIGVTVTLVGNILLATMPVQQTYWAQVFPAMILYGFCPDLVYVAAQVIASNSVSRRQQGVASSLIGTLNLYGNSLGQGFAGTIETEVGTNNDDEVRGYRAALYFAAGLAVLGLALDILFVRVPKDQREGWDDPSESGEQELNGMTTAIEGRASLRT